MIMSLSELLILIHPAYDAHLMHIINMNKKPFELILQHILLKAPHKTLHLINSIHNKPTYASVQKDNKFIDQQLSQIYCDFIHSNKFHMHKRQSNNIIMQLIHYNNPSVRKSYKRVGKYTAIQKNLIFYIKLLNQKNPIENIQVYERLYKIIRQTTTQQVIYNKNYLFYLYRWIINQKMKSINYPLQALQLKSLIVKKLTQAAKNLEEQTLYKDQIQKLQVLEKARQFNQDQNYKQAKIYYQAVFGDKNYDQNARSEALEYLCKESKKRGDFRYLIHLMFKMKRQSCQQKYMKYIQNTLKQFLQQNQSITRDSAIE